MSLRESILLARACSGLMYSGVPMICPVAVAPRGAPSLRRLAMPKSISRTTPAASRMMFGVLRSRWMTPDVVDGLQALGHLDRDVEGLFGREQPPRSRRTCLRSVPSTNSIEM